MVAPISVEQIQAAEAKLKADMAKYPKLSVAVREGRIKWVVEPGEEVSKLIMVDETDPRYHSQAAFNTPQEAEHFTKGFGNEPTRNNGVENFFNRAIRPHYQNTVNDPIRAMQGHGTRDVVQDALSGTRYVTPAIAALMKLPTGPAAVGAGAVNLGLGLASRELTGNDEPWYRETFPNIIGSAATAAASAAGNRYFTEENTRKRQLKKKVSEKLGISEKEIAEKDPGLYDDIMAPLEAKTAALPEYTYGDWRKRPLTQFDAATGAQTMPVTIKRPPMVHADGKSAKIAARKPSTVITDEMATRFLNDLGENRFDANIEDVKKFLKGWTNKLSNEGATFWPVAGAVRPTKGQWTKMVKEETNPFTKMMLRKQVSFDDPAVQKQWEQALDEFEKRWQKVKGKTKSPIITPKEYSGMGEYSFKLPFLRNGDSPVKLGFRGPIRAVATLLPIAAQASLPYIIKAVGSDDE